VKHEPEEDGFIRLWPTLLLRQEIPGHEVPNKMLRDLVLELDNSEQGLTTDIDIVQRGIKAIS
jgi:hypothetical protein